MQTAGHAAGVSCADTVMFVADAGYAAEQHCQRRTTSSVCTVHMPGCASSRVLELLLVDCMTASADSCSLGLCRKFRCG